MKKIIKKEEFLRVLKYIFSSGSSFIIDVALFTIFNSVIKNIIISTIIARIISSLYNYLINAKYVFKNYTKTSIYKYYILVIIQMFASALFVSLFASIFKGINNTIIKICVDVIIFVINYIVQKEVVFK